MIHNYKIDQVPSHIPPPPPPRFRRVIGSRRCAKSSRCRVLPTEVAKRPPKGERL
jgi:hypothetical protein